MHSLRGKVAIVGLGEVPIGRYPDRTLIEAAVDVAEQAIKSAGISKKDIDTVIPIGILSDGVAGSTMACGWLVEEMGLGAVAKSNFLVFSGGSSSSNSIKSHPD